MHVVGSPKEQIWQDADRMDRAIRRESIRRRELSRLAEGLRRFRAVGLSLAVVVLLRVLTVEDLTWSLVTPTVVIVLFVPIVIIDLVRLRRARTEGPWGMALDLFLAGLGQTAMVALTGGIESPVLFVFIIVSFAGGAVLGPGLHSRSVLVTLVAIPWLLVAAGAHELTPRTVPELLHLEPGFAHQLPYAVTRAAVINFACILLYRVGLIFYATIDRMMEAAFDARREALETQRERNRELVHLSSEIAHELKNPLATIKGLVQLIERGGKNAERRFEVLNREIDRTRSILDEFLNFSRPLGALSLETVDLPTLVDDLTALHEGLAADARVLIVAPRRTPCVVVGDPRKLGQALVNLLQNALEAAPPGSRVQWVLDTDDEERIIGVVDEGPGIDEAIRSRATQIGATTKPSGSGIGLAVARAIAEQHGGRLEITNPADGGCQVVLRLPAAPPMQDEGRR